MVGQVPARGQKGRLSKSTIFSSIVIRFKFHATVPSECFVHRKELWYSSNPLDGIRITYRVSEKSLKGLESLAAAILVWSKPADNSLGFGIYTSHE